MIFFKTVRWISQEELGKWHTDSRSILMTLLISFSSMLGGGEARIPRELFRGSIARIFFKIVRMIDRRRNKHFSQT